MRRWMMGLAALAALMWPARDAAACSGMAPTLELRAEFAAVVAIGTFTNGGEELIELEVDEFLKPPQSVSPMTIGNRALIPTGAGDCGSTPGAGHRFRDGQRVLIFLEPNPDDGGAQWKVSGMYGEAAYEIIDDLLLAPDEQGRLTELSSEQARERVRAVVGQPPGEPARRTPPTTPFLGSDAPPAPAPPYPAANPPTAPAADAPPAAPPMTPAPAAPKAPASLAGIPLTPLLLLLVAVGGFGLAAWGMARNRAEPPLR